MSGGAGADSFQFSGQGSTSSAPDKIIGFEDGSDRLALDFIPFAILTGSPQTSLSSAASAAQALLDVNAGTREVAARVIGSDTYIFYASYGGATVNSAICSEASAGSLITAAPMRKIRQELLCRGNVH